MAFILNSCSTSNDVASNGLFSKRKYNKGYHLNRNAGKTSKSDIVKSDEISENTGIRTVEIEKSIVRVENSTVETIVSQEEKVVINQEIAELKTENAKVAKKNVSTFQNTFAVAPVKEKQEIKTVGQTIKQGFPQYKQQQSADTDVVLLVILCFLLPPLAVYLYEGEWNSRCWLNLVLTLLCGLPGVIHALIVVLS